MLLFYRTTRQNHTLFYAKSFEVSWKALYRRFQQEEFYPDP